MCHIGLHVALKDTGQKHNSRLAGYAGGRYSPQHKSLGTMPQKTFLILTLNPVYSGHLEQRDG